MPEAQTYRADIDGLRSVAVLSVIIFHAFPLILPGGFVGVDIFFVISGYLIATILYVRGTQGRLSFLDFYRRRIRRIFPALLLVLLSSWAIGWFVLFGDSFATLGSHIVGAAFFVSNFQFWRESGYFNQASDFNPLLHLWSLGIEEQFYIVSPVLTWLLFRYARRFFFPLLVICTLASFAICLWQTVHTPVAVFYLPTTRSWELAVGCCLAYLTLFHQALAARLQGHAFSLLGISLILVAIAAYRPGISFPGWWALLPTLGAAAIIAAGPSAIVNRAILSSRPAIWIGLISYPLYLWHWPLLSYTRIWFGSSELQPMLAAALLALSVVLAWATYVLLEKPIRLRPPRVAKYLLAAMVMLVAFGGATRLADGFPFRYSPQVAAYAAMKETGHKAVEPLWRTHHCFLESGDTEHDFAPYCVDTAPRGKPLVFLWGDSVAAALYPGLHSLQQKGVIRVAQYTSGACAPLLHQSPNPSYPHCAAINDWTLRRLEEVRPDIVILHADWSTNNIEKLPETIRAIRRKAPSIIYILGSVPHWSEDLPVLLAKHMRRYKYVPDWLNDGLGRGVKPADQRLQAIAAREHVGFVPVLSVFCDRERCRTRLSGSSEKVLSLDYMHLMPAASRRLATHLRDIGIFDGRGPA